MENLPGPFFDQYSLTCALIESRVRFTLVSCAHSVSLKCVARYFHVRLSQYTLT